MAKFYFTFGFGQLHENGYHVIEAKNRETARTEMFEKFGDKWAFHYDSNGWLMENGQTQAEKYNLHEVK